MLRKDDPCYVTNPVQIKLGIQILHFKLHLELNTRKDDDIGLYLTSENKQASTTVRSQTVQCSSHKQYGNQAIA
jgi:hypothetical protein